MKLCQIFFLLILSLSPHIACQAENATAPSGDAIQELVGLGNSFGLGQSVDEFLPPDEAFRFSASARDDHTVVVHWVIADGYYLYRDKFKIQLQDNTGVRIPSVQFPPGEVKDDEFFGRMEVYHHEVEATVSVQRDSNQATEFTITASYQGCAEAGICYPPIQRTELITLASITAPPPATVAASPTNEPTVFTSDQDRIAQSLANRNLLITIVSFFGFGLLLAFTPCVFPMIPILSSILVGQGDKLTAKRGFGLSLVYVLAMASTYTIAGVLAGLFGQNLQAMFQNPWILSAFALVFVLLALSMFGFYKLQIPGFIQSRITDMSNRQEGGTTTGVAVMGFLSALIVGPCVAAPLAGALIYIGQTGDAVLGGAALFFLSMGMGAPLLALGAGAGKLLPKVGKWMDTVNSVFGALLLGLAIWLLDRIVPAPVTLALTGLLLVVCSVYMGCFDSLSNDSSGWKRLWKGLGLVALVFGVLLFVGATSGSKNLFQPLKGLQFAQNSGSAVEQHSALPFQAIKSSADLQQELENAVQQSRFTMVDFYADWCISCKEMEKYTFSDQAVQRELTGMHLLQADVTAYDTIDKALLVDLGLIGPPAILFYGPDGKERKGFRLVGYMKPELFKQHVEKLTLSD